MGPESLKMGPEWSGIVWNGPESFKIYKLPQRDPNNEFTHKTEPMSEWMNR